MPSKNEPVLAFNSAIIQDVSRLDSNVSKDSIDNDKDKKIQALERNINNLTEILKLHREIEGDLKKKLHLLENSRSKDVNYEYIKNIFTKYLLFLAKGSDIEAKQMEILLLDLLHYTKQEKENLEKARQARPSSRGFFSIFSRGDKESVPGVTGTYAAPTPGTRAQSVQRLNLKAKPTGELPSRCDLSGYGPEDYYKKSNRSGNKN